MVNKKFVLVSSDGEDNIAVIDLGILNIQSDEAEKVLRERILEKVETVIGEHFDASEVEISELEMKSIHPICFTAVATIEDDRNVIHFNETWVY